MKVSPVARKYARALFEAAQRAGKQKEVQEALRSCVEKLQETPMLAAVLRHPRLPAQRKETVFLQSCPEANEEYFRRWLRVLLEKKQAGILESVWELFLDFRARSEGKVFVRVEAFPLLEKEAQNQLQKILEKRFKRPVELFQRENQTLLGGFLLHVGEKRLDVSVRGKLQRLRRALYEGNVA